MSKIIQISKNMLENTLFKNDIKNPRKFWQDVNFKLGNRKIKKNKVEQIVEQDTTITDTKEFNIYCSEVGTILPMRYHYSIRTKII